MTTITRTIYKFPLEITDVVDIEMPKGAEILCIQVQHGEPKIWALVDPTQLNETRTFRIAGTGHKLEIDEVDEIIKYIGSSQLLGGDLVFHVFEVKDN